MTRDGGRPNTYVAFKTPDQDLMRIGTFWKGP